MASDRDLSMEVEAHKKTKAQLAAVTAERDALKAKIDAVPAQEIAYYFRPYAEFRESLSLAYRRECIDKITAWLLENGVK